MADTSDKISTIGNVNIKKANLISSQGKSLDITFIIGEISLFEDIFSNTMSGHLLIEDSNDLINNFPLIGQELFEVELITPTLQTSITKVFYVYKLQHRMSEKRLQTYMLNFCSKELISSANSKVAKSFSGNITDTVSSIFRDPRYIGSDAILYSEKTKNELSFVAPYWTPIETINWLTGKSINEKGIPNYLFFETNQSFEFTSVDTLISSAPSRTYIYSDLDANTVYGVNGDIDDKYNIVEKMETDVTFDYLRNLNAGMYSSKLYTLDQTTKTITSNTFDYITDFDKSSHLDTVPLKTDSLLRKQSASIYFIEKNDYRTGDFLPIKYKDFFLQRNSLLEQLSAFKIVIKVHGRTDIKVGNTITYKMPQFRQLLKDEIDTSGNSDYFSGKYLITAIHHQIVNGEHSMLMEIVSDSFVKKLITQ